MNSFLGRGMVTFSRRPCPRAIEAASCFSFRPTSPRKGVFRIEYTAEGCNSEPVPVQEALSGFTEINDDEGLPF